MTHTHDELVKRAMRWLKTTRGCGVVFREHTADFEHPDALGFKTANSIMVECKVSRSDFTADQKKPSRIQMALSLADRPARECWYLTPVGLVRPEEVPNGWGLLEAAPRCVRVVKTAETDTPLSVRAYRREVYRLYCEVRRYQLHGLAYPTIAAASTGVKDADASG